jgi:hypothetical protein
VSTEILPAQPPVQPPAGASAEAPVAPKRKRRGWLIALIVVGVLLVLVVVAALIAESFAQNYARDYVRARLVEVLQLPDDARVDVDLGGGSIIVQALAGRIDSVDADVPEASVGTLSGAVRFHAEGVPLDAAVPLDVLRVEFATGAETFAALSEGGEGAPTYAFEDGRVTLSSEFDFLGAVIPWGLSLEPSAADGALVLTPTSLTLGSQTFEAGADDGSFLGQIAQALLQPQTLCIAASVPQALTLTDAGIDGDELVLAFEGDGTALGGDELSTPGTCPAS